MTSLLLIILIIVCEIFVLSLIFNYYKGSKNKLEIIESNPSLITTDYDQHIRRLNKFRVSNYKGITYYFSKKGGLYYYSKSNVRIYI